MFKFFLSLSLLTQSALAAVDLKSAFQAARLNMETLRRADTQVEQDKERRNQVRSLLLPRVNLIGNLQQIDAPDLPGGGAVGRAFALTRQHMAAARINQPLLRGGSLAAWQMANENVLLAEFQKNASEVTLYQMVINAYYNLYVAQIDIQNLQELLKLTRERVAELKRLTNVGRSRRGELAQAEAQLLSAESQNQQGSINLKQAEETFFFLTQLRPVALAPLTPTPENIGSLEEFRMKVRNRPDIQTRQQEIRVADKQISVAKGGHWPSLDLTGNYYISRTGILETSDWDVGLALTVPIFQGGEVTSAVRESAERKRAAELNLSESVRSAERDVAVFFQNYLQIKDQLKMVEKALKKSEEAYRLNSKDYEFGLATNLDVLQSLNLFIENKRNYATLEALAHMTFRNLDAAVGALP
jgi:outer membrane protein